MDFRNIIVLDPQQNKDLELVDLGEEAHEKPWSFGPAVRDYYLIHYVVSGKGVFRTQERTYQLSAGSGFLITPEEITYYGADPVSPWHYIWVGFTGEKAQALLGQAGLSKEQPIFYSREAAAAFRRMVDVSDQPGKTTLLLSAVYQFFGLLAQKAPSAGQPDYAAQGIAYLRANYVSSELQISDIAKAIGLNRSYFSSVFKEATGRSPQQYLIELRMEKACRLLTETSLSVGDIARSVGYDDGLLFSRIFKSRFQASPTVYRHLHQGA